MTWLLLHLVAVAVLAGVGWVVQAVVYPAFRHVGPGEWDTYHAAHRRAITLVVGPPWLVQAASTVALLVLPGHRAAGVVLGALGLVTVAATVLAAVPAHDRLDRGEDAVAPLLRSNLVRTLAWSAATVVAAALL